MKLRQSLLDGDGVCRSRNGDHLGRGRSRAARLWVALVGSAAALCSFAEIVVSESGSDVVIEVTGSETYAEAITGTKNLVKRGNGTLTLDANALFPNLTKLGIRGTGSMVVNSDNGLGNASGALAVSLQGTGKLTIAENAVIRAKTANAGVRSDGALKWLEAGEYTKANLPDYIDGDGTLIVAEYGGPKGLMLIFR